MKLSDVIKKAILSEKAYKKMEKGIYTFLVDKRSTKKQIANAVKKQFAVDIKQVNVATISAKKKRIARTRKFTNVGGGKKAIVQLVAGQNIALLSPKKEGKAKKVTPKKAEGPERSRREKDIEKTLIEGKESA